MPSRPRQGFDFKDLSAKMRKPGFVLRGLSPGVNSRIPSLKISLILATALIAGVFLDRFFLRTAIGAFFNRFVFFWFGSHGLRLQQGGQNIFDIKCRKSRTRREKATSKARCNSKALPWAKKAGKSAGPHQLFPAIGQLGAEARLLTSARIHPTTQIREQLEPRMSIVSKK